MAKLLTLLWKNLLIRKNHFIQTSLEIILPIALVIVINLFVPNPSEENQDNDLISFHNYQDKRCMARLGFYGNIIYEPSTPFTNALMSKAVCYAGYKKANVKPGNLNGNSSYFNIGVKFELNNSSSNIPDILSYTLYPTNTLWVNLNTLWKHKGPAVPKYSILTMYNVIELQRAIDTSYLFMKNVTANKITLENTDVPLKNGVLFLVPFLFATVLLELLLLLPGVLNGVIQEKRTGAQELMLMIGVKKRDIWVARFLDAYLLQVLIVIGIVIFFYVPLKDDSLVFKSNSIELWAIMMFGLIGCIINLFFFSCLFQSYAVALIIIGFFWIITYLGNNYIVMANTVPGFVLYLTSLLPHTALVNAIFLWGEFTKFGKQVSLTENISGKGLLLYEVLLIMTLNIVIYGILTWYLENVKPGKFGIPKPYNFFLKKSYRSHGTVSAFQPTSLNGNSGYFEAVPANLKVSVSIQNVSKVYKQLVGEGVVAVDNISINFYEGEISALLGHNGAGKTTVFSMITGLTYPTSGKIFINGFDLATETNKARKSLGLCPQQDMLIDDLNAIEILIFYGMLKGLSRKNAKKEAAELIEIMKLKNSERTKSSRLSGGQKRKVSLAIALIGGSKILILDEPTSGMDAEIRREIWELLLSYRKKRTILLTTHFMEEADALCDRIAIMDSGKVKCHGSSMFLKSKFGKGYVLNVVLNDAEQGVKLSRYVKQSVSSAKLKSQNIRTFLFELPESAVDSFPSLLSGLEKRQAENEVVSFSINVASLEEVFLSLRSGQDEFGKAGTSIQAGFELREEPNLVKISGVFLIFQQFWTLFVKKWILCRKSYIIFLLFCILPAALIVSEAFLSGAEHPSTSGTDGNGDKSLSYSLSLYKPSVVLYTSHNESELKEAFKKYIQGFGVEAEETLNITGTIYQIFKKDYEKYSRLLNLGVEFLQNEINIYHNKEAVHMVPVSLNIIHNFLLNYAKQNSSIVTAVDAKFADKDVQYLSSKRTQECTIYDILNYGGIHSIFYIIGPVKENYHGSKELQLMVTPALLYWLTHLIWDSLSFFIFIIIIYLIMGYTQETDSMLYNPTEVLTGYLLWIIGLLLICYVISSFLKKLTAAFSFKMMIYAIFTFIISFLITGDVISKQFQYLHPSCILLQGFDKLSSENDSHFLLYLFFYDVALFCFLLLKDSKILGFILHKALSKIITINDSPLETKEELVKQDEAQVQAIIRGKNVSQYALVARELKRWYFKFIKFQPAVRGISFFVKKGECFGLLGVNGAGKTSTFKMLTGEIASSYGDVYISSQKLSLFFKQKYLFSIGYCPQFGGLIPMFTGCEMLTFFARMRGIRNSNVKDQVHKWLMKFGLLELAKKRWETYSGGNQRKISAAVSVIGDSPLIFLDEPTTGVDPVSRRSIWNLIAEIQKNGQSIILTSHSMDECEALCSRVAIMVKGRFRCIGETTTLKDKYGQGYSVRIKLTSSATSENISSLKKFVQHNFNDSVLVDEHLTTFQYKITNKYSAAEVFKKLTELKRSYDFVESYSASAATLEQIFIGFARE